MQWLTPVISALWDAKAGLKVQGQPGLLSKTPSPSPPPKTKKTKKFEALCLQIIRL